MYIANTPPMHKYQHLTNVKPLTKGEIAAINEACGNGWRKVFNVYAKLLFALDNNLFHYSDNTTSWQEYRDKFLLQQGSGTALLFSAPQLEKSVFTDNVGDDCIRRVHQGKIEKLRNIVHIICGKNHGEMLAVQSNSAYLNSTNLNTNTNSVLDIKSELVHYNSVIKLQWLEPNFAIDNNNNLIVCPYFDYRQLSNEKIESLIEIIIAMKYYSSEI